MPTIRILVAIEVDGQLLPGFPIARQMQTDAVAPFVYQKATGGGYVQIPGVLNMTEVQALLVRPTDQQVTVRLDAQTDKGIVLNPGGFLLVVDGDLDDTPYASLDNSSGSTATISGIAAGS